MPSSACHRREGPPPPPAPPPDSPPSPTSSPCAATRPRLFFFLRTRPPPRSPLFPYTTLFRSAGSTPTPTASKLATTMHGSSIRFRSAEPRRRFGHRRVSALLN